MPPDADDLFTSDPNWAAFAKEHGYLKPSPLPSAPVELDLATNRANQTISEAEWARSHPLSSFGYTSCLTTVKVRDGTEISVKLSYPTRQQSQTKLPVLFVTHGGGWVQGTHITEEAWLLWPLYSVFDLAVISVEYRLASEHKFPTWMDDSWDVLERLLSDPEIFVSKFQPQAEISLDAQKVILSGSSAGAGTAAYLSQTCRDKNIPIYDSLLSSGEMRAVWDLIIPSATVGADLKASPLLGRVEGLRKHLIFVAGQDPLRDEGLAYAKKLQSAGVNVKLHVFPGVPHSFAEFWELDATQRFWRDIREGLEEWLT
ncbi:hypothetical protein LTS07_005159 [Exophiala sideris]|uniref:Alpha/beta hydrolase fold-3 domain-containing protein n=1 Tax=Exophiala sideris TaxID=1016849 RepID=A0ABR0JCH7_9EURO|nr:hypothetical protein LTS07_005159 [Exophiala sideris]KAK5038428.1 hypothetical protein LTR13_004175 [Exophiala sideris]KAK5060311.1 hypothetical protein LTR69_005628 [Exophiala sideris]KAK5183222.1 hypothetical protein LTR44_004223 [Eurotiomycetes sp. CCFEE 6388]